VTVVSPGLLVLLGGVVATGVAWLSTLAHSFPALVVARFLHLEQYELLGADGFERTVPTIERTFG
jgi:hypothetical protein